MSNSSGAGKPYRAADLDLSVVGGDGQHSTGWQRVEKISHQTVDEPELLEIVVAQTVFVGDLVEPVVVRVHEGLAVGEESAHGDHQRRRDRPPEQTNAGEVGGGESRGCELRPRDRGYGAAPEGQDRLEQRWRDLATHIAATGTPS